MALLPKIVCLVLLSHYIPHCLGLIEGARGNIGSDILNNIENPGKIIGELGGDIKKGVEGFAKEAEHIAKGIEHGAGKIGSEIIGDLEKGAGGIVNGIEHGVEDLGSGVIGNIAKGAEELVEDVGKGAAEIIGDIGEGAEHVIGGIGKGIEKGAEGIIDGAKDAIENVGGIVGKLTPKKKHNKNNDDKHNKHEKDDSHERNHHNKHKKDDSRERHGSGEKHHNKHKKEDSRERHDSHEKHHGDRHGKHYHERHTGRGVDRSGIGSRDGIKTPILNLLGMTESICRVSYAAESLIEDLGELHIWADKQMGLVEHAAFNYIVNNIVVKVVDGARRYHHKIIDFVIDTHISMDKLVINTIIEAYRVSKSPIRELFACY